MRSAKHPEKIDIEPRVAALVACLKSEDDVLAAYLYGSYGTVHQTALSDVDLTGDLPRLLATPSQRGLPNSTVRYGCCRSQLRQ